MAGAAGGGAAGAVGAVGGGAAGAARWAAARRTSASTMRPPGPAATHGAQINTKLFGQPPRERGGADALGLDGRRGRSSSRCRESRRRVCGRLSSRPCRRSGSHGRLSRGSARRTFERLTWRENQRDRRRDRSAGTLRYQDTPERAGCRSLDRCTDLICLDLTHRLSRDNRITLALEPARDLSLSHSDTELRHRQRRWHGAPVVFGFTPPPVPPHTRRRAG